MVCLDIDEISEMMSISPFSAYNRWGWASFHDEDHCGNPGVSLRERLAQDAGTHHTTIPDGKIFLLTHLRYFGYNFNPVSFFYCYNSTGYWHVPGARVVYRQGSQLRSFGIASLISWRGDWYVIHFGAVLRSGGYGEVDDPEPGEGYPGPPGGC